MVFSLTFSANKVGKIKYKNAKQIVYHDCRDLEKDKHKKINLKAETIDPNLTKFNQTIIYDQEKKIYYKPKKISEVFDEMVELGLQGVECYSSYHSEEVNDYFYSKAKELGILYTCGSDFHGKTKPSIYLGVNGCKQPQELENMLKEYQLIENK